MEDDLRHLQAASRSSKKKQKKKNALNQTKNKADDLDYEKMLSKLKQKLEEAKSQNDHKKASELRNQVWVLTDVAHGVRTQIPDEELTKILEDISKEIGTAAVQTTAEQKEARESEVAVSGLHSNRMRNLQKKLDQIEALKERVKKGENLEVNQLEKIKSEVAIREEMEHLTQILSHIEIKH